MFQLVPVAYLAFEFMSEQEAADVRDKHFDKPLFRFQVQKLEK